MSIRTKSSEVCGECIKKNKLPPCGVNTFYKSGELNELLIDNFKTSKLQNSIVCPVNAIKPTGKQVEFLSDICVSCGICLNNCPYDNIEIEKITEEKVYKSLSNNVLQLASFLKSSLKNNYEIFTEVKAAGNARNKRIDIVISGNERIYLVKVLSTLSSLGKYERSYTDILIETENMQSNVEVVFLYCEEYDIFESSLKDLNGNLIKFAHLSLNNFNSYVTGGF